MGECILGTGYIPASISPTELDHGVKTRGWPTQLSSNKTIATCAGAKRVVLTVTELMASGNTGSSHLSATSIPITIEIRDGDTMNVTVTFESSYYYSAQFQLVDGKAMLNMVGSYAYVAYSIGYTFYDS